MTVIVEEIPQAFLDMPNLFSPNLDSNNDLFRPILEPSLADLVQIVTFRIYNRYGELVYEGTNPDGWNGVFNGGIAPPEVYAYYI